MRDGEVSGNAQEKNPKPVHIIKRNKTDSHMVFNSHVTGWKIMQTARGDGEIPKQTHFVLHYIKIDWFMQNETDWQPLFQLQQRTQQFITSLPVSRGTNHGALLPMTFIAEGNKSPEHQMPKMAAEGSKRSLKCDCLQHKWKLAVSTATHHHKVYMEKPGIRNNF